MVANFSAPKIPQGTTASTAVRDSRRKGVHLLDRPGPALRRPPNGLASCLDTFVSVPYSAPNSPPSRAASSHLLNLPGTALQPQAHGALPKHGLADSLHTHQPPQPKPSIEHDAATVEYSLKAGTNELEFKYNDKNGKACGPYIVTLTPFPGEEEVSLIKDALVNLIDLARLRCGDFEQVTFGGGLSSHQTAFARLRLPLSDAGTPRFIEIGGSQSDEKSSKPKHFSGSSSEYIDEQLRTLAQFLMKKKSPLKIQVRHGNGGAATTTKI